jgi:hypothetical protein
MHHPQSSISYVSFQLTMVHANSRSLSVNSALHPGFQLTMVHATSRSLSVFNALQHIIRGQSMKRGEGESCGRSLFINSTTSCDLCTIRNIYTSERVSNLCTVMLLYARLRHEPCTNTKVGQQDYPLLA